MSKKNAAVKKATVVTKTPAPKAPAYTAEATVDPEYGNMFQVFKDGKPYFRIGAAKARALCAVSAELVKFAKDNTK